jgi:hypothetical protein
MATDSATWIRQLVCGLHGHDSLLEFGQGRLSLKCVSCGHESPGWDIKTQADAVPQPPAQVPVRRRRFLPALAGARRLA